MPDPKRPLLRYPGGKWRIAKWIIAQFPPHRQYVEPYGGGGSVLLRKPRVPHEVYNDLSGEVVNVFRVMQDPAAAELLIHKLNMTPYSREEYSLACEWGESDLVEQARRVIVRTFMGFGNTGCFKHNTGFRATSFYENRSTGLQWREHSELLGVYTDRLRGVIIENRPAMKVIEQQDKEDTLFYCDPPYVKTTRYKEDIYEHEMNDQDHRDLADILHGVKGMVVISGYHSELYDELYAGWEPREKVAFVSAAAGVNERTEALWLNPACRKNLYPLFQED